MADVYIELTPEDAQFLSSTFPQFDKAGSNFPVSSLRFDAGADEAAFWKFVATGYDTGDITCEIVWYAVNATTGTVRWEAAIAAITPEDDSQDVETDSLATAHAVDDAHLGTTSKRLQRATITISNLDNLEADDVVWLRIRRVGSHGNDSMGNDAALVSVRLIYAAA